MAPDTMAVVILPEDMTIIRSDVGGKAAAGHAFENLLTSDGLTVRILVDGDRPSTNWWSDDRRTSEIAATEAGREMSSARGGVLIVDARAWLPRALLTRVLERIRGGTKAFRVLEGSPALDRRALTLAVFLPPGAVRADLLELTHTTSGRDLADVMRADAYSQTVAVDASDLDGSESALLIDSYADLSRFEQQLLLDRANEAMRRGVRIRDPRQVFIRGDLVCGPGVELEINVIIEGTVVLGDGVQVGANCMLRDARVGARTQIKPFSLIEDASIGAGSSLGPYARIRPATTVGDAVQIGNYVEINRSSIGSHSRINHHSFIGDAEIAERVTIGAGTITCNHDGVRINRTVIERGAYVGSGCSLVAPVRIGEDATVGAGSTITRDVPAGKLTLARPPQTTIEGWTGPKQK